MLSSSVPILPPEVIDLIIDYLHDHPPTLRICSLISRDWLGGSRYHLFNGLYLPARSFSSFRNLLKSPYNTMGFHLRHLHATGLTHELTLLLSLLPSFSRLHSLNIYGNPLRYDDRVMTTGIFPFIHSLALSRATLASYPTLSAFLSLFPALKTLTLDRIFFDSQDDLMPPTLNLDLDSIKITWAPGLFGWLRWTEFSLQAQSIDLDFELLEGGFPVERLLEYFRSIGTHLLRLRLKFRQPSQLAIFSEHPRLAHNTRLRCLRIGQAIWIRGEASVGIHLSLRRLLGYLESSGVEELTFDAELISIYPGQHWSFPPPREVAIILDRGDFPRLQRITFVGPWDRPEDILRKQFQSTMLALLPTQSARGIVHINAGPNE
ncbi:hypothetical protein MSAN_01227400 [Mycena sanguinolenta]|uniref:F-box domain-containing protein n=1 Tax=Mycena sanguinolenta TaxID=230812 RepID=A0A8H7D4B4_9AGAR|nr:hypothetical protein MSAN_01227400 [Mycena sanguinolenta]